MEGLLSLPEREEEFNSWRQVMDSDEKWYSVKEVAGRYGVSRDTISRRIKKGKIRVLRFPSVSPKRKRGYDMDRISESELQRFERCNTTS
jgi:DNA-directed RNA polymerase sigma subunit (sigma70/sigma32)